MAIDILTCLYRLHQEGIWLQDMLGLLFNIRPMIRFKATNNSYSLLKQICSYAGLEMSIYEYDNPKVNIVFIGRDFLRLAEAVESDKKHQLKETGLLLGYPKCCVNDWQRAVTKNECAPLLTLKNTKIKKNLFFLLNYLYNFDTRIHQDLLKIKELCSADYCCVSKYIIPHIPCSFDCRESITYSNKMWALLNKYSPDYGSNIKYFIKRPILFFNDYEFIPLLGKACGNEAEYNGCLDVNNLADKKFISSLKAGDRLKIGKGCVSVFKGKNRVFSIERKAVLFNFDD